MAEHQQPYQQRPKSLGPSSTSKVLAVITLFPVGGTLLCLAGFALIGTLIGLAVSTPLFIIFSPILVPAVLIITVAVAGFLTSGAFGITALSSFSWIINYFRQTGGGVPEHMQHAKKRMQETAGQMGQRAQDSGHKAQEAVRT